MCYLMANLSLDVEMVIQHLRNGYLNLLWNDQMTAFAIWIGSSLASSWHTQETMLIEFIIIILSFESKIETYL